MVDYNSLEKASTKELIAIIKNLDQGLLEQNKHNRCLVSEQLLVNKERDTYQNAYKKACEELAKAYKKYAKKPSEKWLKAENWENKFIKGA